MIPDPLDAPPIYRFGPFEADTLTGELRLNGDRVPFQDVPFRFLVALLERPGEMVSRDQLRQELWPADLNLDFVRALDSAVFKVRQALGDSARNPLYLETLPGKGYRFLGEVSIHPSAMVLRKGFKPAGHPGEPPGVVTPFRGGLRPGQGDPGSQPSTADPSQPESATSGPAGLERRRQAPRLAKTLGRYLWPALGATSGLVLAAALLARARLLHPAPPYQANLVALAPFENRTGDPALGTLGLQATERVRRDLQFMDNVKIALDRPLPAGAGDPLRGLAEATGAHFVVAGSYEAKGGELEFQARLVDPWKGQVLYTLGPWRGPRDDPDKALNGLRQGLGGALGWSLYDNGLEPGATHPPRLDALQALLKERSFQPDEYGKTIAACDEALARDPDFLWARLRKIDLLIEIDKYTEADAVVASAEPYFGTCTGVEREMLRWYRAALGSRPLEALNACVNIQAIHPDTLFFRFNRAYLELAVNRPHSAIRDLAGLPPGLFHTLGGRDWWPCQYLTSAEHAVQDFPAQLREAREAERLFPDVLDFRAQEASALVALGRTQELASVLEAASGVAPRPGTLSPLEMKTFVVRELRAHDHREAALILAAQVLREAQGDPGTPSRPDRLGVALLLVHLGRDAEALDLYRRLGAEDPKDLACTWAAGALLARLGRLEEARKVEAGLAALAYPHLCGEGKVAHTTQGLQQMLREDGPGLIFAMIQKYQTRDTEELELDLPYPTGGEESGTGAIEPGTMAAEPTKKITLPSEDLFPELNTSPDILVMIDEAHRSQASALHANLLRSLPNCARIAFTGTPILAKDKKNTMDIFGDFIDRYTIRQSEEDKATVPILYEGREVKGAVKDGEDLDDLFRKLFEDRNAETQEAIRAKYANAAKVLEAEELIQAKARDMLMHYAQTILPNGLKAQVVATSRLAAIRYHAAFLTAHAELVLALEALTPETLALGEAERLGLPEATQALLRIYPMLGTIKRLDFAVVISGDHNDPPAYETWTDKTQQDLRIARFKKPLHHKDPDKQDGLAFLIVKSMLLTGFDAPVEQALYLDRFINQPHDILQAIARVNRTYANKKAGRVIDYIGRGGKMIQRALEVYDAADIDGALESVEDQIPLLRDRHQRVRDVLKGQGVDDLTHLEDAVLALREERVRADFTVKLRAFLETLDTVLPDPAGLPFVRDAKLLGFIARCAAAHYRDTQVDLRGVGEKVRKLIDDHIQAEGVEIKVEPISILDVHFDDAVNRHVSDRAKASEMEHALRAHIRQHFEEDPVRFQKLSERLEKVLTALKDNWAEMLKAYRALMDDIRHESTESSFGLDPRTQAPFTRVLLEEMAVGDNPDAAKVRQATEVTLELVDHIRQEIRIVDFWRNPQAQEVLKGWVFELLDRHDLVDFKKARAVADRLVDLAKALHERLVE